MLRRLKLRLSSRDDSEHEQAALRIVIVGLVLAYMAFFHGRPEAWSTVEWTLVLGLSGFFAVAVFIFASICLWPEKNVPRRLVGMLADNGGATWYMCLAGEYGFSMVGVFLFVTFGNGFRYGRRYLFGSQALSLLGYTAVQIFVPYWQGHRSAGVGLLLALVVLPLYVSTLLKRVQEARAKAEEANLAKTSFLANMSHEMRTPLNGIVGVVDLLRTTALSSQQVELVGLLRHSISVLRSLVDDVLDIAKIEAGRLTIELVPFDLHACVNGLTQLLRPHAEAKGLALNALVDPALEYRVRGDSHHLRQVLLNLLGNAIKFTERGSVTLSVSLKQETLEGVTARFEVKDTGIGIPAEAISRIFERFVQADESTTRKYGGTGLGTTIAKQLVELMGGTIGVESKLGEGSLFWIEVPLLRDAQWLTSSTAGEPDNRVVTLAVCAPGYADPAPALRAIGQRYEVVSAGSVVSRVEALNGLGITTRAVVVSAHIDQACAIFTSLPESAPARTALVFIANGDVSLIDRARVQSIAGAFALSEASPKLIANAIHVVSAGLDEGDPHVADLNRVLEKERAALRILVAEDNPTNQKIIKQLLESAGYDVLLARDGETALDLYESQNPDLAILDFNMPGRTGIEVIQAIRMIEPVGEHLPAIILSASVTLEARERASNAGADQFLGKPFDASALIREIDQLATKVQSKQRTSKQPTVTKFEKRWSGVNTLTSSYSYQTTLVDDARLAQLEDIARDPAFLAELIQGFSNDVEIILTNAHKAVANNDCPAIADLMHSLKGAAVSVGALRLAELSDEIDDAAREGNITKMMTALEAASNCVTATSDYLARFASTDTDVVRSRTTH